MNTLALLDRAARAISRCASVDEAKAIRDKAQALEIYARQAKQSTAMERQCAAIRLRAERRIGQLLAGMVRAGNPLLSRKVTIGLSKLGITRNQSSKWQQAAEVGEKEFENYIATGRELTTAGVLKLVKKQPPLGAPSGGSILTGPASQLWGKLANGSVDLFLTDPPYDRIDLYEELAELAAAKLKPGSLCLAFCGQYHLPAVLIAMQKHLQWHWLLADRFGGPHRGIQAKKTANTWHPIVAFSNGKSTAQWITDMIQSGGKEKDSHEWQKTLTDVEYIIEKLTNANALVVDPFTGAGTVPAACKKLGRRWLACEIDSKTARIARGRLAA